MRTGREEFSDGERVAGGSAVEGEGRGPGAAVGA